MQSQFSKQKSNWTLVCSSIAVVLLCVFFVCPVFAQSRRLQVGHSIPEFSGRTVDGKMFKYAHGNKRVLLLSFLRAGQKNSESAAEDLLRIVGGLKCKPQEIDLVIVGNMAEVNGYFSSGKGAGAIFPRIIVDSDFKIWGTFGIIACPTTIIGDIENKVLSVKAGHSYDFAPVVQAYVKQALGIEQEIDPDKAGEVKILKNNTTDSRIARNLQMAKVLSDKGKYDSALIIVKKSLTIDR